MTSTPSPDQGESMKMTREQFHALELWVMAAADYIADRRLNVMNFASTERYGVRRAQARELLVAAALAPPPPSRGETE